MQGLCRFPAAEKHVQICAELIHEQRAMFIQTQTRNMVDHLGFLGKLEALRQWNRKSDEAKERQPLTSVSALHPLALSACFHAFYNSLFSSMDALNLAHVDQISSRALRSEIRHALLTNLADAYEELYNGVKSTGAAAHTPQQIRSLLDII